MFSSFFCTYNILINALSFALADFYKAGIILF